MLVTTTISALTIGGSAANAEPSPARRSSGARVATFRANSRAGAVVCEATPQNPHVSKKAKYVIFKTRVTCSGDAHVRIQGQLTKGVEVGPNPVVATSDQAQSVPAGATVTYYTPKVGGKKITGAGWYQGFITGELVSPQGTIGSAETKRVYLK